MVHSGCSSVFDSYEDVTRNKDSSHTTMEFNKNDSFSLHTTETEVTIIFSQYEPVNEILNRRYNEKLTYLRLHNQTDYKPPPNGRRETYDSYWNINTSELQILDMLENGLILRQSQYFSLFTSLKILTYDLDLITNYYLPKYDKQLGDKFCKILISFKFIHSHFELMYYQISQIILNNIIVNEDYIRSIFNSHLKNLDTNSDLFLEGVILFSELFNEEQFSLINLPVHLKSLSRDATNELVDSTHSIIPYTIDNFKTFRTVLPFHLIPLLNLECVNYTQSISEKYEILRSKYENGEIQLLLYDNDNNERLSIKEKLTILFYTPIIIISWLIFSFFVKDRNQIIDTISVSTSDDDEY